MFKTAVTKKSDITRRWYLIDVRGKVLGRAANEITKLLIGKDKPYISTEGDVGDYVVVINAEEVAVTGKKMSDKMYYRHSGFPGGFKKINLKKMMENDPRKVIRHAVSGMLPKNKHQKVRMSRLFVFSDANHDKSAQRPKEIEIK